MSGIRSTPLFAVNAFSMPGFGDAEPEDDDEIEAQADDDDDDESGLKCDLCSVRDTGDDNLVHCSGCNLLICRTCAVYKGGRIFVCGYCNL